MRCLYVLHFENKRHHAGHYLGSTKHLMRRLKSHANGTGAKLTKVLADENQNWLLAAIYVKKANGGMDIRQLESHQKRRKNGRSVCPICNPTKHKIPYGTMLHPTPPISAVQLREENA